MSKIRLKTTALLLPIVIAILFLTGCRTSTMTLIAPQPASLGTHAGDITAFDIIITGGEKALVGGTSSPKPHQINSTTQPKHLLEQSVRAAFEMAGFKIEPHADYQVKIHINECFAGWTPTYPKLNTKVSLQVEVCRADQIVFSGIIGSEHSAGLSSTGYGAHKRAHASIQIAFKDALTQLRQNNDFLLALKHRTVSRKTPPQLFEEYSSIGKYKDGRYRSFYDDGSLRSEGTYNLDGKEGQWRTFSPNGKISAKEVYRDDQINGPANYYFDSGTLRLKGNWTAGMKTGAWRSYFRTSILESEVNWDNNQMHGTAQNFHPNMELKSSVKYDRGAMSGTFLSYHPNTILASEGNYIRDTREGEWKFYHSNGHISEMEQWNTGKKDGEFWSWHQNQTPKYREFFKMDCKEGHWQKWYPNGQLKLTGSFDNNLKTGKWQRWLENGIPIMQGHFDRDIRIGKWLLWHNNGELAQSCYHFENTSTCWACFKPDGSRDLEAETAKLREVDQERMNTLDSYNNIEQSFKKNTALLNKIEKELKRSEQEYKTRHKDYVRRYNEFHQPQQ